jgi:hypothetical protein
VEGRERAPRGRLTLSKVAKMPRVTFRSTAPGSKDDLMKANFEVDQGEKDRGVCRLL